MYCILVAGIPASGKTTTARFIAEGLQIPLISKDKIKEILYDAVGFSCHAEKVKLNIAGSNLLFHFAEQLMQAGLPFVLESNFENKSKADIVELLKKYHYNPITVTLTGDYRTLYNRFCLRQSSPYRHKGHISPDCYSPKQPCEITVMSYEKYVQTITTRGMDKFRIDDDQIKGKYIELDTTDANSVDLSGLLQKIKLAADSLKNEQA